MNAEQTQLFYNKWYALWNNFIKYELASAYESKIRFKLMLP